MIVADGPASIWERLAIGASAVVTVGIIVAWVYLIYRLKLRGRL